MEPPPFLVTVDDASLVKVSGELDIASVDRLQSALEREGSVILDCSDLTFMDSSGIRVLVTALRAAEERGAWLSVVGLNGAARRVLEVSGVIELLSPGLDDD